MSDLQAIADRFEIEALRGEFTDASMMLDWDRFASLFTQDGAWRMPHINEEFVSREEIRAGIERLGSLGLLRANPAPGTVAAVVALRGSLGGPLSGSGITAANRAVLVLPHLAVGAVLIPALRRTAASRTGRPA